MADRALKAFYVALLDNGKVSDRRRELPDGVVEIDAEHLKYCTVQVPPGFLPADPDPDWQYEDSPASPTIHEWVSCPCPDVFGNGFEWTPTPMQFARAIIAAHEFLGKKNRPATTRAPRVVLAETEV